MVGRDGDGKRMRTSGPAIFAPPAKATCARWSAWTNAPSVALLRSRTSHPFFRSSPMTPEKTQQSRSDNPDPVIAAILSSIASVGNDTQTGSLLEEVDGLVTQPLRWFREHIHWPTGMGSHGTPVEVSVSVKEPGHPSFRLLADPQDHRFQLAGNWANYLRAGVRITGASGSRVALLMSQHLDVDPPNTRRPAYDGIRYGRNSTPPLLHFLPPTTPPHFLPL